MSSAVKERVVSIYSPQWDEMDSYGILARKIAERTEATVNRLSLNDADGTTLIPAPGGIVLGYPTLLEKYSPLVTLGRKVAVTMFESTVLPEGWVEALNQFDAVVVPSEFVWQVFRDNGVTVPIAIVPLGIDAAYLRVQRQPRANRPYTFLAIADRGVRKGWDLAWHAFRSAFGDSEEHKLILKCREDGMRQLKSGDANVEILRADLSVEEMAALYARCDCMVFPTRGEGFGLPPREFAATGGVVLATGWGGTLDDIRYWGHPIAHKLVPAWPNEPKFTGKCGLWAEPDVNTLTDMMATVAKYEAIFADSMALRVNKVRKLYQWNAFADAVLDIYFEGA